MSLNSSRTLFHSELVTWNALKLKKEGLVDILLCIINTTKQTRNVIGGSLVPLYAVVKKMEKIHPSQLPEAPVVSHLIPNVRPCLNLLNVYEHVQTCSNMIRPCLNMIQPEVYN